MLNDMSLWPKPYQPVYGKFACIQPKSYRKAAALHKTTLNIPHGLANQGPERPPCRLGGPPRLALFLFLSYHQVLHPNTAHIPRSGPICDLHPWPLFGLASASCPPTSISLVGSPVRACVELPVVISTTPVTSANVQIPTPMRAITVGVLHAHVQGWAWACSAGWPRILPAGDCSVWGVPARRSKMAVM